MMTIERIQQKLVALEKLDIHRDLLVCGKAFYLRSTGAQGMKFTSLDKVGDRLDELLFKEIQVRQNLEDLLD